MIKARAMPKKDPITRFREAGSASLPSVSMSMMPDANVGTGHHCGNEKSDGVSLEIVDFVNRNARKLFGCVSVHANPLSSIGL